jgi:hypothetical protein
MRNQRIFRTLSLRSAVPHCRWGNAVNGLDGPVLLVCLLWRVVFSW